MPKSSSLFVSNMCNGIKGTDGVKTTFLSISSSTNAINDLPPIFSKYSMFSMAMAYSALNCFCVSYVPSSIKMKSSSDATSLSLKNLYVVSL